MKTPLTLILSIALAVGVAAAAPEKALPLPGEVFLVKGRTACVIALKAGHLSSLIRNHTYHAFQ